MIQVVLHIVVHYVIQPPGPVYASRGVLPGLGTARPVPVDMCVCVTK